MMGIFASAILTKLRFDGILMLEFIRKRRKKMKKLYKSQTDKKLCGVCGGIAEYFNIDATIVRLIWALLTVFFGSGVLIYIIAALVMPD